MHHWLALPASTVPLYVEAMTITRYGQVALSVSAYGFATIAVPLVYFRCAAWRPHRAVAALAVGAVLLAGIAAGTRLMSSRLFPRRATKRSSIARLIRRSSRAPMSSSRTRRQIRCRRSRVRRRSRVSAPAA
jgi:hypothetical protein